MKLVFIDFEASSLTQGSFPVEVGWVDEDGIGESHLIRPLPEWVEWDPKSEAIHKITREQLDREGADALWVARRVFEVLRPDRAAAVSDCPQSDQFWLDKLLDAGRFYPIPRLLKMDTVNAAEVKDLESFVDAALPKPEYYRNLRRVRDRGSYIIANAQEDHRKEHAHRALADATKLWRVWIDIKAAVSTEIAAMLAGGDGVPCKDSLPSNP